MNEIEYYDSNNNLVEVWARLPFPELSDYMVSTYGRVMKKDGSGFIKQFIGSTGYYRACLKSHGRSRNFSVHRLIAIVFIPLPKKFIRKHMTAENLIVNHIDGNKLNNRLDNLEWVTVKGNAIHTKTHGLLMGYSGENSHLAKMNNKTARKCCEMLAQGMSSGDIAKRLGISKKSVVHIKAGECWTHMSKDYVFPKNEKIKPNSIDKSIIHEICKLIEEGTHTDIEIAKKIGRSREYVRDIRLGKLQRKISKYYNFSNNF